METELELATNRLSLAHDVPSMVQLMIEWAKVAAVESGGDPQEWVKALAQEFGQTLGDGIVNPAALGITTEDDGGN